MTIFAVFASILTGVALGMLIQSWRSSREMERFLAEVQEEIAADLNRVNVIAAQRIETKRDAEDETGERLI